MEVAEKFQTDAERTWERNLNGMVDVLGQIRIQYLSRRGYGSNQRMG